MKSYYVGYGGEWGYYTSHKSNYWSTEKLYTKEFNINGDIWYYWISLKNDVPTWHTYKSHYLQNKKNVYNIKKNNLELYCDEFPKKNISGQSYSYLNDNFILALIHKQKEYVYKTDEWTYYTEIVSRKLDEKQLYRDKMMGHNLLHFLKINGETIQIPYYKTSLLSENLVQQFVNNFMIMPKVMGYKNICPSMYRDLYYIKKNLKVVNKENIMVAVTLKKLLK
jgi:hypothetical protein